MIAVYSIQSGNAGNRKPKQEKENLKFTNDIDTMTNMSLITSSWNHVPKLPCHESKWDLKKNCHSTL